MTCNPFVAIQVGRTVLTSITAWGGAPMEEAPDPPFDRTVSYAAARLAIARQTIKNALSKYKDRFDDLGCDQYTASGERIITRRDQETLRAMFPKRRYPKGWKARQAKSNST